MSQPKPVKKKLAVFEGVPIPRENPFRAMNQMIKASLGNLPAHLVILFFIAMVIAVLAGLILKFAEPPSDKKIYLTQTLKPEEDQPELSEAALRGMWAYQEGDQILTLEMANGVFELIVRYPKAPLVRYFVRGGYRSIGNVLILQQRADLGSAVDKNNLEIRHYPLNFKAMNLFSINSANNMVWQIPPTELKKQDSTARMVFTPSNPEMKWVRIGDVPR